MVQVHVRACGKTLEFEQNKMSESGGSTCNRINGNNENDYTPICIYYNYY